MYIILFLISTVFCSLTASELHEVYPFKIGSLQVQGKKPHQEDAFYITPFSSWDTYKNVTRMILGLSPTEKNGYIGGIFDGHGEQGKKAADTVKNLMTSSFKNKKPQQNESIKNFITEIFETVNDTIRKSNVDWSRTSGTTALIFFYWNTVLYTAWCGDSRAISGHGYQTIDHSVFNPEEKARIGDNIVDTDPFGGGLRLSAGPGEYGVNMTRSFCDFSLTEKGLIAIPDIIQITNLESYSFILAGSDGLFDYTTDYTSKKSFQKDKTMYLFQIYSQKNVSPQKKTEQVMAFAIWKEEIELHYMYLNEIRHANKKPEDAIRLSLSPQLVQLLNNLYKTTDENLYKILDFAAITAITNPENESLIKQLIDEHSHTLHDNTTIFSIHYDPQMNYNIPQLRVYCIISILGICGFSYALYKRYKKK